MNSYYNVLKKSICIKEFRADLSFALRKESVGIGYLSTKRLRMVMKGLNMCSKDFIGIMAIMRCF